ncbi:MAG: RC-LH1 core complex protein PufX [Rhodobacteraceae bacterium]|nr:RC-LH1 core complex protein PufX [Paracoccaceae bacterium]
MSDDFSYEPSRKTKIYLFVATEMGRGFGWALAIVTVIILALVALRGVAYLLPEESQQAPPPMGALVAPDQTAMV